MSAEEFSGEGPVWRRARDYRLYDRRGRRFWDCWQEGGRFLQGHTPAGLKRLMKEELDRGLTFAGETRWTGRIDQAVRAVFPQAEDWRLVSRGGASRNESGAEEAVPVWRPWDGQAPERGWAAPVVPVPGLVRRDLQVHLGGDEARTGSGGFPEGEGLSGFEAALLVRGLYDLIGLLGEEDPPWEEFEPLPVWWERRGPWLFYRGDPDRYAGLRACFRRYGILLAPAGEPSILPRRWSSGERRGFLKAAEAWRNEIGRAAEEVKV